MLVDLLKNALDFCLFRCQYRAGFISMSKLLSTLVLALPGILTAGDFAFVQKDSPLQVIGTTADLKDSYSRVFVVNVSEQPIQRAQFGWTMSTQVNGEKRVLAVAYGPLVDLNLPPLEV